MPQVEIAGAVSGIGSASGALSGKYSLVGSAIGRGTLLAGPALRVFMDTGGILGEMTFSDEEGIAVPIDVSTLTDGRVAVWREAENKWVPENLSAAAIPLTVRDAWVPLIIGDGVNALVAGLYPGVFYLPEGEIVDVRLWGKEASGSVNIDLWADLFANVPPTVADSITNANHLIITAARKVEKNQAQLAADGWVVAVPAGGYFGYVSIGSVSTFTQLFLLIQVRRG